MNVHLYLKHKKAIGLTLCYALNANLRLDSRDILTLWQKFTKYSQSINSVSKLSVLAKHVLKYIAENFIDLTESVFKSNFTEFVADRLGMEGACCAGEAAPSRLFILFVDALLIMIYEVKLFHLQHQKPEYHSALCGEKLLFKIQS